jgi:hypothetical protein
MAKQKNNQKLDDIYNAVEANPDRKIGWFARLFHSDNNSMTKMFVQLNDRGNLLQEDDKGRIRKFDPDNW